MPDTLENLTNVAGRLVALRKLKKKADPASGISIKVRFGVLSDRLEDEDPSRTPREYIGLECCRYYNEIIDLLIKEQEESLAFWIKNARELSAQLTVAVEKFQHFQTKE
jgi:hypothetical protein